MLRAAAQTQRRQLMLRIRRRQRRKHKCLAKIKILYHAKLKTRVDTIKGYRMYALNGRMRIVNK